MPTERLGLRAWLEEKINNCEFHGVEWLDRSKGIFIIPWKHGSRHGWIQNEDAALFKAWAMYTGRYNEGEKPEPKTWKANFRCAVNALPDINVLKGKGQAKGKNAHKVFIFTRKRKSKRYVSSRTPGLKLGCLDEKIKEEETTQYDRKHNTRANRKRVQVKIESEDHGYNSSYNCSQIDCKENVPLSKEERNWEPVGNKIKTEYDDARDCRFESRRPTDQKLFSFYEILQNIPQIQMGRTPNLFTNQQNAPLSYNACTPSFPAEIEEIDDEVIKRMASELIVSQEHQKRDFDDFNGNFLYHAEYDRISDTSEAMQELLDDSRSYRSHSGSSVSGEDLGDVVNLSMEIGEYYQPLKQSLNHMHLSDAYNIQPAPDMLNVWNDPFLCSNYQQSTDMISALTKALTQELS